MRRFVSTKSISFNGTDEYISCSDSNNLSFGNGTDDQPFSISAWIYCNDATNFSVVRKYVTTTSEYTLSTNATDNIGLYLFDASTGGFIYVTDNSALPQNQWVHVCGTSSGNQSQTGLKIYVNGGGTTATQAISGSYTAMENLNAPLEFGKNNTPSYANGYISRVVIYNKELSVDEIKEEMILSDLNWFSAKSNIVSWWEDESFNGTTLQDRKGGNHGTAFNMTSSNLVIGNPYPYRWQTRGDGETPQARFGGMAWDFDGSNEYNLIVDHASISALTTFSISSWVRTDALGALDVIVGKYRYNFGSEFMFYKSSTNKITLLLTGSATDVNAMSRPGLTSLVAGSWYHVVCTWDGGFDPTNIKIYLNGIDDSGTGSESGTFAGISDATASLLIGSAAADGTGNPSNFWDGKISDTIIFDRALTATEVSQIYNNGQPRDELKTNLYSDIISYWRPYNSSIGSNNVLDLVGVNHGTFTNGESTDIAGADRNYPVKIYDNTNKASFDFDGTNEHGTLSDTSLLSFGNGTTDTPFSFVFFLLMDDATNFRMFAKNDVTNNVREYFLGTDASDKLTFAIYDDISTNNKIRLQTGTMTAYQGQWCMVGFTYNGSGTLLFYVNGKPESGTTSTNGVYTAMSNTNAIPVIGINGSPGGTTYANGKFCHVSAWSKELSVIEMEEIYNRGTPPDLTKVSFASNIIEWWKFDNNDSATGTVTGHINSLNITMVNMESGDKITTEYPT